MKAIISALGKDNVGIIANICTLLSEMNVNILEISQTILQGDFTMIMMVDITDAKYKFDEMHDMLKAKGNEMGIAIHIQREEIFDAMHRI